jgi:aspartate racemase
MDQPKTIGIIAVSAPGAALCYSTICAEGAAILGPHDHPPIVLHTHPLARYMRLIEANRWHEAGELLLSSADALVHAGADILICPDNTLHQALDLVCARAPAQWLHIVDEVAAVATSRGFKRLGILGTRYLMDGPVYRQRLARRGIAFDVPSPADRQRLNAIIFDELVYGRIEATSRRDVQQMIDRLGDGGCDAVVLGCTEIPLLIHDADSALPAIDSTRTVARAALREATRPVGCERNRP